MTYRLLPLLLTAGLAACATPSGPTPSGAAVPASLANCDSGPHCASSLATDADRKVDAFVLKALPDTAWPAIVAAVNGSERTHIVQSSARYLRAEVISPWHFYTDDLELMLGTDGRVDIRSSSRIGYYDFGVNRQRIEALRAKLAAQGVVAN